MSEHDQGVSRRPSFISTERTISFRRFPLKLPAEFTASPDCDESEPDAYEHGEDLELLEREQEAAYLSAQESEPDEPDAAA